MAIANQVYTILNSVSKQMWGEAAIAVTDTSSMVAMGTKVLSSSADTDAFWNVLPNRIGRTVFSMRRYVDIDPNVVKHSFDFGLFLQKIYVDLPAAMENYAWEVGSEDYTPTYAPVIKPSVKNKIFDSLNVFDIDVTVPDSILKTAFLSAQAMGTLISAIFMAQDNALTCYIESLINLTRGSFIARKLNGKKACGAINLLTDYNTRFTKTLTAAAALTDADFLKYSSMTISMWCRRMRKMSSLFNEEGYRRHTSASDLVLTVLDEYAAATASYLEADTFHRELVALPRYNTVPYWQGSGKSFAFADTSAINIKLSDELTVAQTGIIAVAYDYQALGAMIDRQYSETERNNRDQYTNYYTKLERGMFNDMSENGIVFYIADKPTTETTTVTAKTAKR